MRDIAQHRSRHSIVDFLDSTQWIPGLQLTKNTVFRAVFVRIGGIPPACPKPPNQECRRSAKEKIPEEYAPQQRSERFIIADGCDERPQPSAQNHPPEGSRVAMLGAVD
ncbi:hypothetical protein K227x_06770 [Rubripirellula lacrimiformis]|uniref:Uncharacterized protein n=1 Tax=Rubripirellula lacrimiformis TaxID=1930273 RepID=A0A517N5B1_9BACT|nr:hypothetical protein K227x_06770 [Rubripirellula lacrimiformis]